MPSSCMCPFRSTCRLSPSVVTNSTSFIAFCVCTSVSPPPRLTCLRTRPRRSTLSCASSIWRNRHGAHRHTLTQPAGGWRLAHIYIGCQHAWGGGTLGLASVAARALFFALCCQFPGQLAELLHLCCFSAVCYLYCVFAASWARLVVFLRWVA